MLPWPVHSDESHAGVRRRTPVASGVADVEQLGRCDPAGLEHRLEAQRGWFGCRQILAGEDLPAPKPSPLCFEPVFESCRITPAELLYVGDARGDWRAATDAGVGFVRMYRPWQQWSAPAVTTVRELTEVAAVALA